jgi:isopentenyl-diphosphate Delta-isomerase
MANPIQIPFDNADINASERKKDHIEMAFKSRVSHQQIDTRFYYEPLLSPHPVNEENIKIQFLGKIFSAPIWVSSMTGGTTLAGIINKNLAKACGDYGLGMGLGSCRQLLYSDDYLDDFQIRKYMTEQPLYANLGIAQLETLIENNQLAKVNLLLDKLEADGLIIHVNPLQEWLQPEGDKFKTDPLMTIKKVIEKANYKIIVKEVGQGMGPESLEALMKLPIEAIDFGASGGTNFALLEILRSSQEISENYGNLSFIGHSAADMVEFVHVLQAKLQQDALCNQFIISGGVSDFLDGYYLTQKLSLPAIYGQASGLLKHAQSSYEELQKYLDLQIKGLSLAKAYLRVK